ncbi:long-chain-fatty-acid--CoA ligase [compost metagenome]
MAEDWLGGLMVYSSGTTGRPKGVRRSIPDVRISEYTAISPLAKWLGFDVDSVYLSTAPLSFALNMHYLGATLVFLENFDEHQALAAIERHRISHSQWVATMFVRMLKLPAHERNRYDLSSHRMAVHSAAPCPIEIKRQTGRLSTSITAAAKPTAS